MATLQIIQFGTEEGQAPLNKIRQRFVEQLSQASATATQKTVEVFGEAITPLESVRRIIDAVRERGDEAVLDFSKKLDRFDFDAGDLRVSEDEIEAGYENVDSGIRETLHRAAANIRRFQQHIKIQSPPVLNMGDRRLGVAYRPLDSAGLYIPGGTAAYPSTVLMTAIPAAVAGVKRIALCCLPGKGGNHAPEVLAAARIAGVKEIYRVGGVQAVAALAFGTQTIARVSKIIGPGNLFVMLAKREILGVAGIDLLAGPSEVVVLADETADPSFIAADLLAQAEHDTMASSIVVTPSDDIAAAVAEEVDRQLAELPRAEIARQSIEDFGLAVVAENMGEAIAAVNGIAPEHVEIMADESQELAKQIENAGAIFLGPYTPEPVGDYIAGPSHVLPTGGTARFFAGLSVNDFLKRSSLVEYSEDALKAEADHIERFANAEGLDAHARAVTIRKSQELE